MIQFDLFLIHISVSSVKRHSENILVFREQNNSSLHK